MCIHHWCNFHQIYKFLFTTEYEKFKGYIRHNDFLILFLSLVSYFTFSFRFHFGNQKSLKKNGSSLLEKLVDFKSFNQK